MDKIAHWQGISQLICPLCKAPLALSGGSFCCERRHTFDISKQAYVNFAPQSKPSETYHKERFQKRRYILEQGYYVHILEALQGYIDRFALQSFVDVGCGEGYYTRNLVCAQKFACDLSKDSIQLACKADKQSHYFVADIACLPLTGGAVNAVLDIFSPANYNEFVRVAGKGWLIKVIPGKDHLQELRALLPENLGSDEAGQGSAAHFLSHFPQTERQHVSRCFSITKDDLIAFADMTPLFFHIDSSTLPLEQVTHLTIEADILATQIGG